MQERAAPARMPVLMARKRTILVLAAAAALCLPTAALASPSTGAATCKGHRVSGKVGGSSGAAGTITFSIVLTNKGPACTLKGYAGLRLVGKSGLLPTTVKHGGINFLQRPVKLVTLGSGKKATILVAYEDVPVGSETSCPAGTAIRVRPPGQKATLRVKVATTACGGGQLWESPVLAGVVSPA